MLEKVHTLRGGPFCRQASAGEVVAKVVTVPMNWATPVEAGGVTGVSGTVAKFHTADVANRFPAAA